MTNINLFKTHKGWFLSINDVVMHDGSLTAEEVLAIRKTIEEKIEYTSTGLTKKDMADIKKYLFEGDGDYNTLPLKTRQMLEALPDKCPMCHDMMNYNCDFHGRFCLDCTQGCPGCEEDKLEYLRN